jgi:hypothetical protein
VYKIASYSSSIFMQQRIRRFIIALLDSVRPFVYNITFLTFVLNTSKKGDLLTSVSQTQWVKMHAGKRFVARWFKRQSQIGGAFKAKDDEPKYRLRFVLPKIWRVLNLQT